MITQLPIFCVACVLLMVLKSDAQDLSHSDQSTFFVENQGQWDGDFAFKMQGGGAIWYVTTSGMTIDFRQYERAASAHLRKPVDNFMNRDEPEPMSVRGHVLKMNFVNANPAPEIIGEDKLSSYSNYFLGRDSCKWRSRVPHYQKVLMKSVWQGIDVELVAQKEGVEVVYRVAPYADPSLIQIEYEGLDAPLQIDGQGNLILRTSVGDMREKAPFAYQEEGRSRRQVEVQFQLPFSSRYALSVSNFDPRQEVVIDPLIYSSLFGGTDSDFIHAVTTAPSADVILAGDAYSADFPTIEGAYQDSISGEGDWFVSKFSADGRILLSSTYLGGAGDDNLSDLTLNLSGDIWIGGIDADGGWPVTADAFDTTFAGNNEATLALLSADGTDLLYSTYFGGSGNDGVLCLDIDNSGVLYFGGSTTSPDLYVTPDAMFSEPSGGYLTAMDADSRIVLHSTFWGIGFSAWVEGIRAISFDEIWIYGTVGSQGQIETTPDAFQTGRYDFGVWLDGYFARLDLQVPTVEYSSYLGRSQNDKVLDFELLGTDTVCMTGETRSPEFPITPEAFDTTRATLDGFVLKIHLPAELVSSTFVGGEGLDWTEQLEILDDGSVIVAGETESSDLPFTHDAFDSTFGGPYQDVFLWRMSDDLSDLIYGTYIGGGSHDHLSNSAGMAWAGSDSLWLVGRTSSLDFPRTDDAFMPDAFPAYFLKFQVPGGITSISLPTSIPTDLEVSIFPNPTNSTAILKFYAPREQLIIVSIYNIVGQKVFTIAPGVGAGLTQSVSLPIGAWPSGMYVADFRAGLKRTSYPFHILR